MDLSKIGNANPGSSADKINRDNSSGEKIRNSLSTSEASQKSRLTNVQIRIANNEKKMTNSKWEIDLSEVELKSQLGKGDLIFFFPIGVFLLLFFCEM